MAGKVEMCYFYTTTGFPTFKAKCLIGLRASLRCHRENTCPGYCVVKDEFGDYPSCEGDKAKDESSK